MNCSSTIRLLFLFMSLHQACSLSAPTQGKIALVTGGNKGIGKEICRLLAKDPSVGATILACRSIERGQAAIKELEEDGCQNLHVVKYDLFLQNTAPVHDFVQKNFGQLDILVNNAAVCFNDPTLYGKVEYTPFEQQAGITMTTNFGGSLKLTRALMRLLVQSTSPRLINIASAAGRLSILKSRVLLDKFTSEKLTIPELVQLTDDFVLSVELGSHASNGWPSTCYGMSKLAIIAMTKVMAREHSTTIMCNSVDPGYCDTDQNDHQGPRPAADGATTAFLLATLEDDLFVTGKHWFDEQIIEW